MEGEIRKLKELDDIIYPITRASAVYLSKDTTVEQKTRELEHLIKNNSGLNYLSDVNASSPVEGDVLTYIRGEWKSKPLGGNMNIELETWGISQGFPTKPYSEDDYLQAFNNVEAINEALKYAKEAGYSSATLPTGDYSVCYPEPIELQSHLTLNLGGARLKVMYDSENRSPFDSSSDPVYLFGGSLFVFSGVKNAHLTNGEVIGDMYERSFVSSGEVAVEHTNGVQIKNGSSFCSVSSCEVHGFAGDCLTFVSGGRDRGGMTVGATSGSINEQTGALEPAQDANSNTVYSPEFIIDREKHYKTFSLGGQGYSRNTTLNDKYVDVFFYGEGDVFIGVLKGMKVQTPISIPIEAEKFRMMFYEETDENKDFQIFINWGSDCHHNVVEYNEFYNGHRGGLQLGGSYNIIQHNIIRDSGKFTNTFLDGIPAFNDTTRYLINQEDSFGENSIIRYNHLSGGFHALLLRSWSIMVEGNVINNITASALVLYSIEYASIKGNYIQSGGIHLNGSGLPGKVIIEGNFLREVNFSNVDYSVICVNNHIRGSIDTGDAVFENNWIFFKDTALSISGNKINKNCFLAEKGFEAIKPAANIFKLYDGEAIFSNNDFYNVKLFLNLSVGKVKFKDCLFVKSELYTSVSSIDFMLEVEDGKSMDSYFNIRSSPMKDSFKCLIKGMQFSISESYEHDALINILVTTYNNVQNVFTLTIKDCHFIIEQSELAQIIEYNYLYIDQSSVHLLNNSFQYVGDQVLYSNYFDHINRVASAVIADNKLDNIVFRDDFSNVQKFSFFDPDKKGLTEPNEGYFNKGDIYYNANPAPGGYIGWVALNQGYANQVSWIAEMNYEVGDIVNSNNTVYLCTVEGTSGTTGPNHDADQGTAIDGTVTWSYLGNLAVFKSYGPISL
ncbi:hypothetical protein WAK64_11895 [Bacillus spongiae]|uniref:Right-handed parallel beta-helix repeat-containing protein n=1 Tax=Bacillus spongiae TaxID=2683610 RepID=A0ABU8HEG6_9BACI